MNNYELFTFNTQYIRYQEYKKQQQNDIIKNKILDLQYIIETTDNYFEMIEAKKQIEKLEKEMK
jgi:hypothetical protein